MALHVLNPTPILISANTTVNKEHVPVEKTCFSDISLKLVTNLTNMELYDSPFKLLVVLHFQPISDKHKRLSEHDYYESSNKPCIADGSCSTDVLAAQSYSSERRLDFSAPARWRTVWYSTKICNVPITRLKNKLSDISGGIAHAFKENWGASLRKIAQKIPNVTAEWVKKL